MLLEFDKQFSDLNLKNVVFFSEVSTILKIWMVVLKEAWDFKGIK